jgi:hypothetical protein
MANQVQVGQWGFVSPGQFAARLRSVDQSIVILARAVKQSTEPKLNKPWRAEFSKFIKRWQVERDSYTDVLDRMLLMRATQRLDAFEQSYQFWAMQFEARTGVLLGDKPVVPMNETVFPVELWWILGAAALLYAWGNR